HVIVRPHPQSFASEKELMDKLMQKYNDPAKVEWNRDNDNFDVLHRSDILISDFSGVLFDYSLVFDKPVIYTGAAMDKSPYDCAWSEKELWSFEILPKLGMELEEDKIDHIKEVIDECIESPAFKEGRDIARRETWVNIGEGAEKTVDYLINKYKELTAETVTPEEGVAVA
ncbi:MAG: CDP-glycerol glycerophosphotransferase family protein, partial [Lachnospiraceae bacterium]|nr:CDP-glycerol glycerophosphotransferase family protein [Lachnospiraceae bacterium]